jgi:putative ABC transport system permease protein
LMTLAMGLFGGMVPALRAVRLDVISALREL